MLRCPWSADERSRYRCVARSVKRLVLYTLGKGFDRHLLGLKITAERLGKPTPAFFESEIYKRMGHFVLSTSTLSTETIVFGAFGPVVPDGYGIAYNVVPSKLGAVVSSFKVRR